MTGCLASAKAAGEEWKGAAGWRGLWAVHFWLQVKTLSWQLPNVLSCESQPSAHSAVKLEAKAKRGACRRSALRSLRDGFQKTPALPPPPRHEPGKLAGWQSGSVAGQAAAFAIGSKCNLFGNFLATDIAAAL